MALTEKEYSDKLNKITRLCWDMDKFRLGIQCRTTNPNPYCEKELDEATTSMIKLLVQLQTHNVDKDGDSLIGHDRWWFPDIIEDSKAEVTQLA